MYLVRIFSCLLILQSITDEGDASHRRNERPIIGILSEEYYSSKTDGGQDGAYIAASYVKMVESSGARVVPIMIGQDRSYYQKIVKSVNGILFPGGGLNLWAKGGYGEAAQVLYELVLEVNKQGTHFPLFGVCLGLEVLAVVSSDMSKDILTKVVGVNDVALNLNFLEGSANSHLYSKMPQYYKELLSTKNITSNHHSQSFTRESLRTHNLNDTWRPLTTNVDSLGNEFISSMEHVKYPHIFGTQFHPEKIVFEWTTQIRDPHTLEAILSNRYFYDYFVEHARWNKNMFRKDEEESSLIYNYCPKYTPKAYFQQRYFFKVSKNDYMVEQV